MTKKDFVAIMEAINDARNALPQDNPNLVGRVMDSLARSIASVLASQSGKFKRVEFLKGCGIERP